MKNYKICMLYCYFGVTHWYFDFFIKSCACNPSVKFVLFTDIDSLFGLPENLEIHHTTLNEISRLASSKIGLAINICEPYKLCDFKPAYGVIFSDFLKGYDFWGHGDLDVIFGDIRQIITDDVLRDNDVISAREEYITGFFALFRNSDPINRLYEKSRDYKLVFQSATHFCFDECNFLFAPLMEGKSILDLPSEIESMTYVIKKAEQEGQLRAYFNLHAIEGNPGDMEWNKGELVYADQYYGLLYHLIKFKSLSFLHIPRWSRLPNTFYINKYDISKFSPYSWQGKLSAAILQRYHKVWSSITFYSKWKLAKRHISSENLTLQDVFFGAYLCFDFLIHVFRSDGILRIKVGEQQVTSLLYTGNGTFLIANMRASVVFAYKPLRKNYFLTVTFIQTIESPLECEKISDRGGRTV